VTEAEIEALRRSAEAPVRCGPADLELAAQDLSAAFAEDPVFQWFLRDDAKRSAGRLKLFQLLTGLAHADGEVWRPQAGGAAAMWMPSSALGPTPFLDELRVLPSILSATGFSRLSRMSALRAAMDRHHPKQEHAYLWFIGVTPDAQGHGIGGRLLAAGLAQVDARGLPAYLESSNLANVPLYRRHGFEVTGEIEPAPGAPKLYAMWREAKA
jgi:ribosomal protein S18 acetylase RimI-like enzyme